MDKTKKVSKAFKKKIKSVIETSKISQAQFAKKCDVAQSIISKILSGNQICVNIENYNKIKDFLYNNKIDDNINDGYSPSNIQEKALKLKKKYDLSISDMARVLDTDKENIQMVLSGSKEMNPELPIKIFYYLENEDEFINTCQEKRYIVSKFDKQKIIDKTRELYNSGIGINQLSIILHTSISKVQSILDFDNNESTIGYPANIHGRDVFNSIINDTFDHGIINESYDEINNIDQEQLDYHNEYYTPEDNLYMDNRLQNIIGLLEHNINRLSEDDINKLENIINVMITTDIDNIKIHIDIDL